MSPSAGSSAIARDERLQQLLRASCAAGLGVGADATVPGANCGHSAGKIQAAVGGQPLRERLLESDRAEPADARAREYCISRSRARPWLHLR